WVNAPIIRPSVAHHMSLYVKNYTQLRHVTNQDRLKLSDVCSCSRRACLLRLWLIGSNVVTYDTANYIAFMMYLSVIIALMSAGQLR
ncbi:MAG: hypothetical protein DID89_008, partial [Candidatus Nitrotoga sp. CP45]